ncbi:MAG: hypothetical protein JXJ20_03565 [Anaerolineae bacterium]|nr:hypothetical protein [Anaerolineae bacterium]
MIEQRPDTRMWMSGIEVKFFKWTPNGLIYTRVGSQETMAYLSRNTIHRLLEEGVLRIQGYRPAWAYLDGEEID